MVHVLEAVSCWPGLLPVWPTYFHFPKQKHTGHLPLRPRLLVQMPQASLPCPSQTPRGELPGLLRFWLIDAGVIVVCCSDISCVWLLWGSFDISFFCFFLFTIWLCLRSVQLLSALSSASMRLNGWQCSKTTELFWCTDIHGSFVEKCWEMLNMVDIMPAKHHRVNIVTVSMSGLTLAFS